MHRTAPRPAVAADPSWTRTRPKPGSQEQAGRARSPRLRLTQGADGVRNTPAETTPDLHTR
ncbi:hypothetical protein ABZ079_27245 [Streptomyces sp. NPDC006314]|uniref:hypothetical protein n=1 Tax=Streptomyces sp. NPDC006314 TaxID=3154475 RepID=UPI0033A9D2B3